MNQTQAFLLEIFVKRLAVRERQKEKHKSIGFKVATGNKDVDLFDDSVVDMRLGQYEDEFQSNRKRKPKPTTAIEKSQFSVVVYFSEFDPIVIEEDEFADFEKDTNLEDDPAKIEIEKKLAKAAGLSPKEYQDRMKNPELKRKKFHKGKSCLFRMTPTSIIRLLKQTQLNVKVVADKPMFSDLGEALLEFPPDFVEAVTTAAYSSAMREMIAREGHIWWPRFMYRETMLQEVREAQRMEKKMKKEEITQEEKDFAIRFKNLCEWPLPTTKCSLCDFDDPCDQDPLTYEDLSCCHGKKCCAKEKKTKTANELLPTEKKKKMKKINRKGAAWLMYPSPEPIVPPPLPITAETNEVFDVIDDTRSPTAVVKLFIRLSCFGNALEVEPRPHLDEFPL